MRLFNLAYNMAACRYTLWSLAVAPLDQTQLLQVSQLPEHELELTLNLAHRGFTWLSGAAGHAGRVICSMSGAVDSRTNGSAVRKVTGAVAAPM